MAIMAAALLWLGVYAVYARDLVSAAYGTCL